jgi:hypothetical protein
MQMENPLEEHYLRPENKQQTERKGLSWKLTPNHSAISIFDSPTWKRKDFLENTG